MNRPTCNVALVALLTSSLVAPAALAQSDVPGTGSSTFPRFMIIFDNSRSMQTLPTNDFDDTCAPNDDFTPGSGVVENLSSGSTRCNTTSTGGTQVDGITKCRNKFCIGKSVMYDVLDSYASLSEVGFATYYQYLRRSNTMVPAATRNTTCTYDVLAGAGEIAKSTPLTNPATGSAYELYALSDIRGSCMASKAAATKTTSLWYTTQHSCIDRTASALLLETPKTCRYPSGSATPSFQWSQTFADIVRYNDDLLGSPGTPARRHGPGTGTDPWWVVTSYTDFADAVLPSTVSTVNTAYDASSPTVAYYLYSRYLDPVSSTAKTQYQTVAPGTGCVAAGTVQTFTATPTAGTTAGLRYNGSTNWGCTAANPCEMTMRWVDTPPSGTESWYESKGSPYTSTTSPNTGLSCTSNGTATTTLTDSRVSLTAPTCSATVNDLTTNTVAGYTLSPASGCSSTNKCDLTGGASNTNTNTGVYTYDNGSYNYSASGTPVPYAVSSSSVINTYYDIPAASPAGTSCLGVGGTSTFTGTALNGLSCSTSGSHIGSGCLATHNMVAGADPVTGIQLIGSSEPRTRRCNYTVTKKNLTATWYNCKYTRTTYNYNCGGLSICQWQRTTYTWKPRYYRHEWLTTGGELLGTTTYNPPSLPALGTDYLCGNAWTTAGFSSNAGVCPATYVDTGVCAAPRKCVLTWRNTQSAGTPTVSFSSNGRLHNVSQTLANFNSSAQHRFCAAPDRTGGYLASAPLASNYSANWCGGVNGTPQQNFTYTDVMSDPYTPTSVNTAGASGTARPLPGATWPGGITGEVLVNSEFSTNGTTWSASPIQSTKASGWSRTAGGVSSLNFVDIGPGTATLPTIKQIMSVYNASTNPNGLRMAHATRSGQNTPLYGSLTNVKDYIASMLDTDSAASCRDYAVLLVTDGQESQPDGQVHYDPAQTYNHYTQANLVSAITSLKNVTSPGGRQPKSMQTFVIGFGDGANNPDTAPTLNAMAIAAGTDIVINAGTGERGAYAATDATTLRTSIFNIFGSLTANTYTRSKPVLSATGTTDSDKIYYGFFKLTPGETEWKGFFNSYDLSAVTPTGTPTTRWKLSDKLDTAGVYSGSIPRRVYTYANGHLVNFNGTVATADKNAIMTTMGLIPGTDDTEYNRAVAFLLNQSQTQAYADAQTRDSRLSAVYHSTPAVMGAPPYTREWPGADNAQRNAYESFKTTYATREGRVYVGSNSGMLHAVCDRLSTTAPATCRGVASTGGDEAWSFVPPTLLPRVRTLYNQGNLPMVDGSFGAADVCTVTDCTLAANWRTQLIGSLREGGRALFAMNVTDPSSPTYEWSFTEANFGDSWSAPVAVRVKVGSTDKFVALVGGGNASSTEPEVGNRFYAVDVGTGAVLTDGTSFAEYRIDQNAVCSSPPCSFPIVKNSVVARPAVTRAGDTSVAELAFVGDTQGRISRMDLKSTNIGSWASARFFDPSASACSVDVNATAGGAPIYDADDDTSTGSAVAVDHLPFASVGDPRAIYQRISVGQDKEGRVNAYVGTGDAVNPLYVDTSSTPTVRSYEYFYALRDNNSSTTNLDCSGQPLWVKRFKRGQKVLSEAVLAERAVIIATYRPSTNPCSQVGDTVVYAFDRLSGIPLKVFETVVSGSTTYTSTLVLPNAGISSDLLFLPTPGGGGTGKLVLGTSSGDVRAGNLANLATGVSVKGWRRRGVTK